MRADWTRLMWTSSKARAAWEPRIQAVSAAWLKLEVDSVRANVREAALVFGKPEVPLPIIEVAENRYAVGPGAKALDVAYRAGDDETVGMLLGFPACCRAFFRRTWGGENVDTTWEMADRNYYRDECHNDVHYDSIEPESLRPGDGPFECNILGRWLGVRLVPHLPCSFHCPATVAFARLLEPLWPAQELAWAKEILSWPIEWSALHGIAEIRLPVVKISTRTTYTAEKRNVQRMGTRYPAEGASGIVFPYAERGRLPEVATPTSLDNGFVSMQAMERGHTMVLNALRTSPPTGYVADLGAGNGALVDKIKREYPAAFVGGIEVDARKAGQHPNLLCDDLRKLLSSTSVFDTLIISQRRFEEIEGLEKWCMTHARQVLVYSYDEPQFAEMRQAWVHTPA